MDRSGKILGHIPQTSYLRRALTGEKTGLSDKDLVRQEWKFERLKREFRALIRISCTKSQTLCLVVDDLQWANEDELAIIEENSNSL